MEYLEGVTLKSLLKKLGSLSPGQVVAVASPVLDALSAAHAAGVIHRDLKPANIFISLKPVPSVKILDFGISKFSGQSHGVTQTGMSMGTPAYMAPEQVRGEKQIGPEADLYSMGAILYNLLSGHPPFEGESDLAVVARVLTDSHQPLAMARPDLPPKLTSLVDRLLTKPKEQRPKDASLVRRALETIAQPDLDGVLQGAKLAMRSISSSALRPAEPDMPTTPTTPTGGGHRTRPSRPQLTRQGAEAPKPGSRAPLIAVGIVALALLGGGGVWFALSKSQPARPPRPTVVELPPPTRTDLDPKQAEPAPAPEKVTLKLSAEPKGLKLSLDGKPLACNPCELSEAAGKKATLEGTADGYVSKSIELEFDEARDVSFALAAEKKGPVTVAKHPPPPEKEKKKPGLSIDESNPYAR